MRDTLFRGKIKGSEVWVEGNLTTVKWWLDGSPITVIIPSDAYLDPRSGQGTIRYIEVIPETVGQFTGKYDKNGKKIFEGDIVRARMYYGPAGFYEVENVSIGWSDELSGYQWQYFDMDSIEVTGNIYDNSELSEGRH